MKKKPITIRRDNAMPIFVVRFWAGNARQVGWRGRVDHLQSNKAKMFNTITDLLAFVDKNR